MIDIADEMMEFDGAGIELTTTWLPIFLSVADLRVA